MTASLLKSWVVDRLAAGLFNGECGPDYWLAVVVSRFWWGFKAA